MSTAHLLMEWGYAVIVVDPGPVGGAMTQRTTAHISNSVDDGWRALVPAVGTRAAALAAAAYAAGAARIALVQEQHHIACDFTWIDGYLVGNSQDRVELAYEKCAAEQAGIRDVDWLQHSPLPGDPDAIGLRFPGQARLHPLNYLNGLARVFRAGGGVVRRATVTEVRGGRQAQVRTKEGFTLHAGVAVVLANNSQSQFDVKRRPQALYTSYALAAEIPEGAAPDAAMWDLEDPYHYVRLQPVEGRNLILIGGEDHPADEPADAGARFARLERWARRNFPALGAVAARWSGNIKQTDDNLGFMGRSGIAHNVFVIDGDGGLGFNHATIGALIIGDLIQNRPNPWAEIFEPLRAPAADPLRTKNHAEGDERKSAAEPGLH